MRKTSDLVNEMRQQAKKAWLAAIVVGFETETKFVFSSDRTPLQNLNQLVKNGGSPLGLLRFEKEGTKVQGSYRAFSEYASEAWVPPFLAGLLENTGNIIVMSQDQQNIPEY